MILYIVSDKINRSNAQIKHTNTHRVNATHTRITDTAKEDKTAHEAPATPIEAALDVGEGDAQSREHTMEQNARV